MDVESFGLDIEDLHNTFKQGMQTVREFQDPIPDITIMRVSKDTGESDEVGIINAIKISFGLREGNATSGTPVVEDYSDGEMKIPARGFIPLVGDTFEWGGKVVKVTKVYPERLFTVTCEIAFT